MEDSLRSSGQRLLGEFTIDRPRLTKYYFWMYFIACAIRSDSDCTTFRCRAMVVVSKPLLHQARGGRLVSCCSSLSTEGPPASTTSMPMTLRTARWRRPRRSPNPVSERSRNCAMVLANGLLYVANGAKSSSTVLAHTLPSSGAPSSGPLFTSSGSLSRPRRLATYRIRTPT
jgi:hypothetical protein